MAVRITTDAAALKRSASAPPQTSFTLAGWFKFASIPARFYGPLGIYAGTDGAPTSGSQYIQISSTASGSAQLVVAGGSFSSVNLVSIKVDTWYFIALTCSSNALGSIIGYARALHEKELTIAPTTTGPATAFTAARFEFGRDAFTGDQIDGAAQYCIAFDRALDAAELLKLSNALLRGSKLPDPRNLNVFYRLRGADDIQDRSGNARPLTATVGANAPGVQIVKPRRFGAPAVGSDVSLALTGVQATGGVGTLALSHDEPLTGNAATSAVGTITPSNAHALTGNAATSAVGTVTPSSAVAVTGNAATAAVGTVTPGNAIAISGNAATIAVGNVTPSSSVGLTGNAATGQVGTLGSGGDGSAALTGVEATTGVGTLAPAHAQALTGNAATGDAGTVAPGTSTGITGNFATAAVGSVAPARDVTLSGVSATSAAGSLTPDTSTAVSGNEAHGQAGTVGTAGENQTSIAGVQATGGVGTLGVGDSKALTGNAATTAAGNVGVARAQSITGNEATGSVGTVMPSQASTPVTGTMATTDEDDTFAASGAVLISGSLATTDEDDTFEAAELPACETLKLTAKDPQVSKIMAAAFLDKYGRFAKVDQDVVSVRLFYPSIYCAPTFDLTRVQYLALDAITRDTIKNAGSAAGLIDTDGISNA